MKSIEDNQHLPLAETGASREKKAETSPSPEGVASMEAQTKPLRIHWRWSDLLLTFFVGQISLYVGGFIIFSLVPNDAYGVVAGLVLEVVALVGSVYLLGLRRSQQSWTAIGICPAPRRWVIGAIGLGVLMIFVSALVGYGVQLLLGDPNVNPQQALVLPRGISWASIIGNVLLGGFAVPFAEELMCRGVLYSFVRERWGVWVGVMVSALVFGMLHFDLAVGLAAFVTGCVSALVYERTRSLWPSIIIHSVNNGAKFLLIYALLAAGTKIPLM